MDVELPDGRVITDVPEGTTRSELMRRVQAGDMRERMKTPEYQAKVEAQRAADRDEYNPTRGMGPLDLASANWSAGYGNLVQGIRQLAGKVGIGSGVSDEEIREKRQRDELLAQALPYAGRLYQAGGEALPLMAIPGAAFQAPLQAAKVGPMTALLGAGAGAGAAGAALSPVTADESRGQNMAMATMLGAAIPAGGSAAVGGVRGARRFLTESGAADRALLAIAEHIPGAKGEALRERLMNPASAPTLRGRPVDVPTSAAQATGSAELAQLEAASRSRPGTQPAWADFDAARNAGLYDLTQKMAPSERVLDRAGRMRDSATAPMREGALDAAAQTGRYAEPVLAHAQTLIQGASGANPAVAGVAKYVARELGEDAAGAVTPARLYEVRKVLASKLSGPSAIGDELSASIKGAQRETRGMIEVIDDALDAASSGQWSPYLQTYAARSKPITSGRAKRDIFEKIEGKPLVGTADISAPQVTAAGYGQAVRQYGEGSFGSKFTSRDASDVQALDAALQQAEMAGRTRKLAATQGGGSITNSDQLLAVLTTKLIDALPGVGGYAGRVRDFNAGAVEREIARLLQSPTELGRALRSLSPNARQELAAEAWRRVQVGAGVGAGQQGVGP